MCVNVSAKSTCFILYTVCVPQRGTFLYDLLRNQYKGLTFCWPTLRKSVRIVICRVTKYYLRCNIEVSQIALLKININQ